MTPTNATSLMEKWKATGESGGGAFLTVPNLVMVPKLSADGILRAVSAMLDEERLA